MKTIIRLSVGVGALLGVILAPVRAAEPPRQPPSAPQGEPISLPATTRADKPAEVGQVLVLDNEHTLTGNIERVGDQYRIKRLLGETWVPAAKVMKLCASLEEAHRFLQSQTNLDDPDERLRLADWCRQHHLHEQAIAEVQAAVDLCPSNEHAQRLLGYLREAKEKAAAPPKTAAAEKTLPRVDVTAESLTLFATRVQPILMNACANCHTAGRGGSFQLTRTYSSGLGNRRSVEQNLAMAVSCINPRDPQLSRLLTKAVSIHAPGMTTAPLKGRQTPPYRTLER
jgi:hypothetical protein